jgi:hypothetical protein
MAIKFPLSWEMNYHLLSERQQEQRNGKVSGQGSTSCGHVSGVSAIDHLARSKLAPRRIRVYLSGTFPTSTISNQCRSHLHIKTLSPLTSAHRHSNSCWSHRRKGEMPTCPSTSGNQMKGVSEILHKASLLACSAFSQPNFRSGPNTANFLNDVKLLCVL